MKQKKLSQEVQGQVTYIVLGATGYASAAKETMAKSEKMERGKQGLWDTAPAQLGRKVFARLTVIETTRAAKK